MAKHAKRRTYRKFRPTRPTDDDGRSQQALIAAAQALVSKMSPEELQREYSDCGLRLEEADRQAQMEPSPPNLARFRAMRQEYATLEAALAL